MPRCFMYITISKCNLTIRPLVCNPWHWKIPLSLAIVLLYITMCVLAIFKKTDNYGWLKHWTYFWNKWILFKLFKYNNRTVLIKSRQSFQSTEVEFWRWCVLLSLRVKHYIVYVATLHCENCPINLISTKVTFKSSILSLRHLSFLTYLHCISYLWIQKGSDINHFLSCPSAFNNYWTCILITVILISSIYSWHVLE